MWSPLAIDAETFSARFRNAVTVYQLVSPSTHSLRLRSYRRCEEARRKLQIDNPDWVRISRGGVATIPVRVMVSVMPPSVSGNGCRVQPASTPCAQPAPQNGL